MPGKIHVPVTVATDGFTKLQRTFSRLKGATVGLTAALGGLGIAARAIDFGGAAVQGARDLERNYAGLASVFKENTEQMKAFGATASDIGLSMNEAAKATTFIGSVLKQSGFSIKETSDLTEELVELGADLALTYGYDVQEALLGMTALFRGEYDPIEKFGVAMKQSEIDAEKAARGLDGLTGAEERFADQQIRVEFLMERASDAMGAFERQSGNLTVQQMRLRAEFENVRDTVGVDLLPVMANLTGDLREIVDEVGPRLEETFKKATPVIATLGNNVMPVLEGALNGIIDGFNIVIDVLAEAQNPTTELGDSMQALGQSFERLFEGISEDGPSTADIVETISESLEFLADSIKVVVDTINENGDEIFAFLGLILAGRLGRGAAGALGKKNVNVQTLEGIATNIGLIGAALLALPKGVLAIGIIGALIGNAVYKNSTTQSDLQALKEDLEDINYEIKGVETSFATSMSLANAPIASLAQSTDDLKTASWGYKDAVDETFKSQELFNDELTRGQEVAEQLGLTDGLPSWYDNVRQEAAAAYAEVYKFKEATLDILQIELRDLIRFGAAEEDIKNLRDLIIELKTERGDYLVPDDEETGETAKDYVKDFFDNIKTETEKQAASLDLESLGLSEALISQILGSEGWEELFQTIIDGGAEMARQLQDDFNRTAAGVNELKKAAEALAEELDTLRAEQSELQQQIIDTHRQQADALADATEAFNDYKSSINVTVDALQTYEREIGRFESQTRTDLQRIESQIMDAFDNGYLLEEARNNLLDYARAELNTLIQLQRQRDELLARRNAAADVILGVADAVTAAGNITQLLSGVQDEVQEVQVKELFEDVVESADGLNGFKVTVERNYTDVISNTVSKSKALVNGFQDVVDRTRAFIDNLKILRELGLDPFLFNQLVEAGAEAGGATAQALVDGGAETVNEVNKLQGELEAMGVELGEETYEVTKNSGEQFVSGILDGIDSELDKLGEMAETMALGFTQTFEMLFNAGMESAFETITDTINAKFQALLDQLNAKLAEIEAQIARKQAEADSAARDVRVATGQSIIVEGVEVQEGSSSIGPDNIGDLPASEQAFIREAFPELFPSSANASSTVNVYNITASNPLDAYNASKGNVEQQSNFQSSNGSIAVTLSGVGN